MIKKNPSVSIIIPARNEAGTVRRIVEQLPSLGSRTEIIFIENRSSDNTLEEIKKIASFWPVDSIKKVAFAGTDCKNRAEAIRLGFEMAKGDMLMTYDADMTVPPEELRGFFEALLSGPGKLINGTRFKYPMQKMAMQRFNYLGNKIYAFMVGWLVRTKITDTLCGTKALWREDWERIKDMRGKLKNVDPFGEFELLLGAASKGLIITEVSVHYKARVYGETKTKAIRDGWPLFIVIFLAFLQKLTVSNRHI